VSADHAVRCARITPSGVQYGVQWETALGPAHGETQSSSCGDGTVLGMWSDRSPVECPCGSGTSYAACCGRLHRGAAAETAEELMRSRYAAFVVGDVDHLFRTWHPRTRPDDLTLPTDRTWTGLVVLATDDGGAGDDAGVVEFEAHYVSGGRPGVQHEVSRFERRRGVWVYVDAGP
jgi:SEC-C motif domain protein